jgi:hypothetical protein
LVATTVTEYWVPGLRVNTELLGVYAGEPEKSVSSELANTSSHVVGRVLGSYGSIQMLYDVIVPPFGGDHDSWPDWKYG